MKNAVVIQHVPFEDLGHIEPLLRAHGYRITTYQPPGDEVWTIDPAHLDLLAILGGPMSANDHVREGHVADELALAVAALHLGVPMLGICLGAQIMALAAGGRVAPMPRKEIGLAPMRLTGEGQASPLRHLPPGQPVLHWHGEAIELPAGAIRLAETDACSVQAFMLSDRALGLQCHLEADLHRLREWTEGHAAEVREAGVDADALLAAGARHAGALRNVCRDVVSAWLETLTR